MERQEHLFKLVWRNCVILKEIYRFVRLYNKNKLVKFSSLQSLRDYKEKEFIERIQYTGDVLKIGDLPEHGVLKEINFENHTGEQSSVNSNSIPYGVEIIKFGYSTTVPPFKELPSSVHTLKEVSICEGGVPDLNEKYYIPPNITSIDLNYLPNISGMEKGWGYMTIPNTVRELIMGYQWCNEKIPLRKGDIPEGVTSLELSDSLFRYSNFTPEILPVTSLKRLSITIQISKYGDEDYFKKLFNCLPLSVEDLTLCLNRSIDENSNFVSCTSIKKLNLFFYKRGGPSIGLLPNSLPQSITELKVRAVTRSLEIGSIPNAVKKLILEFDYSTTKDIHKFIKNKATLPQSITSLQLDQMLYKANLFPPFLQHLQINNNEDEQPTSYTNELIKMVQHLPKSLTSITLPRSDNEFDNSLIPSTIKHIKFN